MPCFDAWGCGKPKGESNMSMGVDIERIVQDLGKVSLNQVLQEAIMNSIHANAKNISIDISYKSMSVDLPCYVHSMDISDDGEGFTKENTESFSTYKTTHKKNMGAKGVGRFLFLKLFNNVLIDSLDKEIQFNINDVTTISKSKKNEKTVISFSNVTEDVSIDLEKIENNMKEHFLPYFHLMKNKPKVNISLSANQTSIFKIDSQDIPALKNDTFQLKKQEFSISYILEHYEKPKHKGFYCADGRVVIKNNKDEKAKLKSFKNINILFLLSSDYLDGKVNDTRDDFSIHPKQKNSLLDELSWADIQEKLSEKLKEILLENNIDIEENSKKELEIAIKNAPYLSKYITDNQYGKDSVQLINEAEKKFSEDKQILRNDTHTSQQEYKRKLSLTTQTELAEYIFDRQKIIDSLKKITNEETLEQEMHNLFMKKNTSDESQNYKSNNLWLFDDRFMIYDKIFSDQQIKQIFPELSDNLHKPDILSVVSNTYIKDDITDIVIIELKKPINKITPAGAEEQLLKYARYVNQSSNDNKIRIWAYAFLAFGEEVINSLNDKSYNKIPTHSQNPIYYKYHNANSVIINFMDYLALADDANTRNTTFMNILKSQSTINQ